MDSFLALSRLGLWKDQQQIALKLHNAFPGESRYLYWALLSMIFQSPNRCAHQTAPRNHILVSIAHRCLQTLLNQNLKDSASEPPTLEDSNNFWMVLKVLEMVGQWFPHEDHSKIVGIGRLKYPESLFRPSSSSPQLESSPEDKTSKGDSVNQAQLSSELSSLSFKPNAKPIRLIESRCPELPEYISLVREDYFKIFDSDLGQEMRNQYLHLELLWRQRAVEWANSTGLKELIYRMKDRLCSGDRNWSTMTTLNQSVANLLRREESAIGEFTLLDNFYIELNANQKAQKEAERGYSLARVDLRFRFQDASLSKLEHNFPHIESLDQVIYSYFDQFGPKPCCFDDLVPYLKSLTSDEKNKLSSKLKQMSTTTSLDQESSFCENFLCRQINLEKIIRSITSYAGDQQVVEATRLLKSYFQYLPLGHDLPATALQPADGLAILAAQALIQDWQGPNGSVGNLYSAAYILEACLSRSTHQYQARSLLIRLYRLLGNSRRSLLLFTQYGIKHIQHDTLSHLGLDRCSLFYGHTLPSGDSDDSERCLVQYLIEYPALIYEYIEDDTLTWINNCYVEGKYIQVEDLHFFNHQISFSLQRKITRMERMRLQLFEKTRLLLDNNHKKDGFNLSKNTDSSSKNPGCSVWDPHEIEVVLTEVLRDCQFTIDNRDLTVIPDCQPWSNSGTCKQTSLGPSLGSRWLWAIGATYARIVLPHVKIPDHPSVSEPDFFSECSPYEVDLNEYSKTLGKLVFSPERHLLESHAQHLINFFQRRNEEFETLIKTPPMDEPQSIAPSQLLAIIHNVYEGFCLFDFAFRQFGSSSFPSFTKLTTPVTKTLGSIKTKILSKLKKLDLLIEQLLGAINQNSLPPRKMMCLFGSSLGNLFPWRDDAVDKDFGSQVNWDDFLVKSTVEQRQTLDGWHSLVKLIIQNYH